MFCCGDVGLLYCVVDWVDVVLLGGDDFVYCGVVVGGCGVVEGGVLCCWYGVWCGCGGGVGV